MGYGYDTQGRLDEVSEPGIGTNGFAAVFGYVPDSDLPYTTTSKAGDVNGTPLLTGTRGYDDADRLTSIGYARPDNTVVTSHGYILDAADRRTRADREDGTAWSYGYNDRDEVTSAVKLLPGEELLAGWQQTFDYDNLGNRKTTHEGGNAAGANRRQTVYAANALNQYTSISHPNAFDVLGRAPSDVSVTVNEQPVTRQGEFWRSEVGDLPNALAAVWQPVQVDAVDPGAGPNGADVPARRSGHRFVPMASETPFYDFDGNLVSDARWIYGWNGENQLIEMTTAASALAAGVPRERYRFVYDSRSRRIARTVESWDLDTGAWVLERSERFVHDDWNVVAVVDAAGEVVQRYAWGNDLSGTPQDAGGVGGLLAVADAASGQSWCYAYDGNGNVSAVVDLADGAKVGRYDYDAFGRTIATWGDEGLAGVNPYRFSTKPLEGTGLCYYGFRYYQPETGRWLSRDPIGEDGGINLLAAIENLTVNSIDFLGLSEPDLIFELTRRDRDEFATYGKLEMKVNNEKIRTCCGDPKTFFTLELPVGAKMPKFDEQNRFTGEYFTGLFTEFSDGDLNLRSTTSSGKATSVSLARFGANISHKPQNVTNDEWDHLLRQGLFVSSSGIAIHKGETSAWSGGCILPGTSYVTKQIRIAPEATFPLAKPSVTPEAEFFDVPGFDGEDSLRAQVFLTYYTWCAKEKVGAKNLKFKRVGPAVAPLRAKPVESPELPESPKRPRKFFPNIFTR